MFLYVGGGTAFPQITNMAGRRGVRNEDALYGFAVPMLVSQIGLFYYLLTLCVNGFAVA